MAENSPFLMYKGRPLVRSGNTLYYGSMAEKYVIVMQVLSTKDENDMKMAEKIQVQLMLTDPEVRMKDRIVKKSGISRWMLGKIKCWITYRRNGYTSGNSIHWKVYKRP